MLDTEGGRGVALRVEIDHEDPEIVHRQRGGQVHCRGGLADATLLVGHHHHARAFRTWERVVVAQVLAHAQLSFQSAGQRRAVVVEGPQVCVELGRGADAWRLGLVVRRWFSLGHWPLLGGCFT